MIRRISERFTTLADNPAMRTHTSKMNIVLGLTVVLSVLAMLNTSWMRALDDMAYALGLRILPARAASEQVVIIDIDDASLAMFGSWPWDRSLLANLMQRLYTAKLVGLVLPLDEPQNVISLQTLTRFANQTISSPAAQQALQQAIIELNTDHKLAHAFATHGRVLIASRYAADVTAVTALPELPNVFTDHLIYPATPVLSPIIQRLPGWLQPDQGLYLQQLSTPVDAIANSAMGSAFALTQPAWPGESYARPVLLRYADGYLPSFALLASAMYRNNIDKINVPESRRVMLGEYSVATDYRFRIRPYYYRTSDQSPAFRRYSFKDVIEKRIQPSQFTNKIVLIGHTAGDLAKTVKTPIVAHMPAVLVEAHTISSLLQHDVFASPDWSYWLRYGALLVIALYLILLLPRLNLGTGFALSALLLLIFANIYLASLVFAATWVPLMAAVTALVIGHSLFASKRLVFNRFEQFRTQLSESNRLLGQAYQFQGQLDMAFEKYRLCQVDDELLSLSYNLGLDYERKRQFNKAANVFRFLHAARPNYRDSKERIEKNLYTSNSVALNTSGGHSDNTLVLSNNGVQKPMLGRYKIESELGRGAMGTVYLGVDPKIGRTVAIKTMPLSSEFESEQLEEVKQRFFREAKTAGRLNHYNIVTIYDVGEDQDLAYIAMDYLQGIHLANFTQKKQLLRVRDVFNIMLQVGEALHYAHAQNVVHRDIKPANIIYDRRNKKATITDFGIAHITDTNKTKTGTILGTPSFMPPEQLAGKTVDGRSDIFSLGVMFFQLLTGELPFVAQSISTLMYKIANEEPRDILQIRAQLPVCIKAVINKTLQKDPNNRYQTGAEFVTALRRCQKNILAR